MLAASQDLQMGRVYAATIAAFMVYVHASGNRAYQKFIDAPMRIEPFAFAPLRYLPISRRRKVAQPIPAPVGLVDLVPDVHCSYG